MTSEEIASFSILAAFGSLVGIVGGLVAAKRRKNLLLAVAPSTVVAVVVPLVFWFIWTAIDAMQTHGYSLGDSLLAGIGSVVLLAFSVPFLVGLPAVVSAATTHILSRQYCSNRIAEQDGADQPATAPEPESEGQNKPKPESEVRPQ